MNAKEQLDITKRCFATTKSGQPCTREAKYLTGRGRMCTQHRDQLQAESQSHRRQQNAPMDWN